VVAEEIESGQNCRIAMNRRWQPAQGGAAAAHEPGRRYDQFAWHGALGSWQNVDFAARLFTYWACTDCCFGSVDIGDYKVRRSLAQVQR